MTQPRRVALAAAAVVMLAAAPAVAHWCSNIWISPSRILVKPEKSTVYIGSSAVKFRVYVQNNFPYTLFGVQLRGNAGGFSVSVSPGSHTIQPGQNVSYTFTVSRSGPAGNVNVNQLDLQVKFRPGNWPYSWFGNSSPPYNSMLDQNPTAPSVAASSQYNGGQQWASLSAATLARKFPTTTLPGAPPTFGRTGLEQLIHWFGYRFCYNSGGNWRCGGNNCPTAACGEGSAWTSTAQFPQNCIRAGAELAVMHSNTKLGSKLQDARDAAVNALKGRGSAMHKCMAAVVGGHLWEGASNTAPFTSALTSAGNSVPNACQAAANRLLGTSTGSTCSSLPSSAHEERAACAAAEGIKGNDGPVASILVKYAGDGYDPHGGDYKSLFYAYMLYMVTEHRRATVGNISYYPDAGAALLVTPDTMPWPDTRPWPDQKIPPRDQKVIPPDQKIPPRDQKIPPRDQKVIPPDQKVINKDQKVVTPDQKVVTPDQKVAKKDQKVAKKDQKVTQNDGGIPPTDTSDRGCSCTMGGGPGAKAAGSLWLFLPALLWWTRRRRR